MNIVSFYSIFKKVNRKPAVKGAFYHHQVSADDLRGRHS